MSVHGGDALEVLHLDNHLLAVRKPAGLPVVPDSSGDESLLDRARAWLGREFEKPGAVFLGVVQRLDRPVSGVVLFARTSKAANRLTHQFREGRVQKRYLAVGAGPGPEGERGELEQWLLKNPRRNRVGEVAPQTPESRCARTAWRVLEREGGRVNFEFEPHTGRSHQLRVAAATLGAPLLGDLKYGAREPLPDRSVALHAVSLEVDHPTREERIRIECPPPARPWWAECV